MRPIYTEVLINLDMEARRVHFCVSRIFKGHLKVTNKYEAHRGLTRPYKTHQGPINAHYAFSNQLNNKTLTMLELLVEGLFEGLLQIFESKHHFFFTSGKKPYNYNF